MIKAKIFEISGIVQGVGFRPFIYRLAKKYYLFGEVLNTEAGVYIRIEGDEKNINFFYEDIEKKAPPLSFITNISVYSTEIKGFKNFFITESENKNNNLKTALIPQDVSICADCLKELFNPTDRRYKYPFINCTNCGPRYTIIKDLPYDRHFTTMTLFKMCDKCLEEYKNPENRRFHAEPNACPVCGPKVFLYDNKKNPIKADDPIDICADLIKKGFIVAIKGIGGFHLAVNATNNNAVFELRQRKRRPDKPFALMSRTIKDIEKFAYINKDEKDIIESFSRPIALLKKKEKEILSEYIAPRNNYFGVMLPYTPLHYLLFEKDFTALVMTSANISGEPIISDNSEAFEKLGEIADFFLIHNRDIFIRCDDSILKQNRYNSETIRRSRGFAPSPIFLKKKIKSILALGGELKNTICLTKGNKAFVSQYIGDVKSFVSYNFFEKTIEHLKKITGIEPQIVAYDNHPDYLSSRCAKQIKNVKLIGVWHHHAHIISCAAENNIYEPVIGIALDGAGLGCDNNIWGGEIIVAESSFFTRKAHIGYAEMPGADVATKEPFRMGISYLYNAYGDDFVNSDIDFLKKTDPEKIRIISEMIKKKINSPLTSSAGRLFDGVCAMLGLRNKISFEAQAAMELESIANLDITDFYIIDCIKNNNIYQIPFAPVIKGIVTDLLQKVPIPDISAKFHNTIIEVFARLCVKIKKETKINKVALSGGVFHNSIITDGLIKKLSANKFKVLTHKRLPANDGGISLGQAIIADRLFRDDR